MSSPHIFCFGFGYTASYLPPITNQLGWSISGSKRPDILKMEQDATHILLSIPPIEGKDIVYENMRERLRALPNLKWVGYLSTTGVYGDTQGRWVNEDTPINPPNARTQARAHIEQQWLNSGLPTHIFRLAGIYGPQNSVIDQLNAGTARCIDKPGQVFSRIHVEDIAQILVASMQKPNPGRIYNVADDEPCPQHEVVRYAANLMKRPAPTMIPFDQAELSEMARSFYQSNRRVSNQRIKDELGITLKYPSYREGIQAILKADSASF